MNRQTPDKKPSGKTQNSANRPTRPPVNSKNRRPAPPKKQQTPPPRRRNEESYVFSRSLSETQERILAERRERLEDAKKFRREDVKDKLLKGLIAFGATFLALAIVATIIVSSVLNDGRVKKNKGEYVYKIGSSQTELAYSDAMRNKTLYISMNSIAELCELTLSGNTTGELRFYTPSGEYVGFVNGSSNASVNGYGMPMPAVAIVSGTRCDVPIEFLKTVLGGVDIEIDNVKNLVTVKRIEYPDSTPLEPRYESVAFMLRIDSALDSLDENRYFAGKPIFDFKNDLSAYESFMNPTGAAQDNFLILLNKENPCDSGFKPSDLGVIPAKWVNPDKSGWLELELDNTAIKALEAMMLEMRSSGFSDIYVTSAYRSYNYQSGLYNTYIEKEMAADPSLTREEAAKIVETYSAVPGYSEHHTGLCVDFITTDMVELTNVFAEKEVYDWLCANAWKFGFILRYPEDKVDVTGYSYESWHWRFVGRAAALEVLREGDCFEEYMASRAEN